MDLTSGLECSNLQGDTLGSFLGFVDIKTKVPLSYEAHGLKHKVNGRPVQGLGFNGAQVMHT